MRTATLIDMRTHPVPPGKWREYPALDKAGASIYQRIFGSMVGYYCGDHHARQLEGPQLHRLPGQDDAAAAAPETAP